MKYVLFIPIGGFNDCLVQIKRMVAYCSKFNRILLLDLTLSEYGINAHEYFDLTWDNIIYDTEHIMRILSNKMTVFPTNLGVTLLDVLNKQTILVRKSGKEDYFDRSKEGWHTKGGIPLKLPSSNVSEDVIFFVSCGGGFGIHTMKQIRFKPSVSDACVNKLSILGDNFLCLQIRSTDLKCDYKRLYEQNKKLIHSYKNIYLATDSKLVLTYFKEKGLHIYNFTTYPEGEYTNLHNCKHISPATKFMDMVVDLFICAKASKLLSNSRGGYITLIQNCRSDIKSFNKCFHL